MRPAIALGLALLAHGPALAQQPSKFPQGGFCKNVVLPREPKLVAGARPATRCTGRPGCVPPPPAAYKTSAAAAQEP